MEKRERKVCGVVDLKMVGIKREKISRRQHQWEWRGYRDVKLLLLQLHSQKMLFVFTMILVL